MDSSHTSCAEKCFGLLFKFECSPKLRFQALYSLTLISFFYFLQTQFSVSLKVFTLKATLKTQWFCEDPEQTLNLETSPDLICPNASWDQVYGARAKFIFKGTLCSQFLLRRFYLCSSTGILTSGWVCLYCIAGCMTDSRRQTFTPPARTYCVFAVLWERVLLMPLKMQETIKESHS